MDAMTTALGYYHPLIGSISDLGPPNFEDAGAFAEWVERVRSIAFFSGARHDEITKVEVAALLPHIRALASGRRP